jgi:hypothetical protein
MIRGQKEIAVGGLEGAGGSTRWPKEPDFRLAIIAMIIIYAK